MTQPVSSSLMPRDTRRREQVAVFSIAQYSFVISAASIQEIRSTDSLGGTVVDLDRPVLRKVRHIVERDSRAYYVVSGYEHFRLPLSRPTTVLILRSAPVPSFVPFQVGTRRVALSREAVAELIASPLLFSFPHTTPLITGVVLRRG